MKNYFYKRIETAKKHHKCPVCKEELTTIINSEIFGRKAKILKENIEKYNLKIDILGCAVGDDRDFDYYCQKCYKEYLNRDIEC